MSLNGLLGKCIKTLSNEFPYDLANFKLEMLSLRCFYNFWMQQMDCDSFRVIEKQFVSWFLLFLRD